MAGALTSLFRAFRDGIALQRRRELNRLLVIFGVVKLVVVAGCLALLGALLWMEWPRPIISAVARPFSPDPLAYLTLYSVVTAQQLQSANLAAVSSTYGMYPGIHPAQTFARALISAIAAGDPVIAPRVVAESGDATPETPAPVDDATEIETIGTLAHPGRSTAPSDGIYILAAGGGITAVCLGVVIALFPIVMALASSPDSFQPATLFNWGQDLPILVGFGMLGLGFALLGCAGAAWALVTRRYARMERQGFTARVDADGVTVQRPGLRVPERLLWSDVQGFARLHYRDDLLREHDAYLLIGAESDLLWAAPPLSRYVSPQTTQQEEALQAAAYRLVELVRQRAQTPVRDVSVAVRDALPNPTGELTWRAWNVAERATYYASIEGDDALAGALWERLRPGKRLPGPFYLSMVASTLSVQPSRAQIVALLRVARALLPYYPTPEQMARELRTRFLSRGYSRYEIALQLILFTWVLASLVLSYLQLRQRFG